MLDVSEHARMVPMLPCADIDELAEFWTALGLQVTYRQVRPNPYLALRRNAIELHYYGLDGFDPDQSHSTCSIVLPDTAPLHELFAAGLTSRYGRVPMRGVPRMTRPRQRANNAGLSGFSIVDPAGNWIRVSRQPDDAHQPRSVDDRTEWVSAGAGHWRERSRTQWWSPTRTATLCRPSGSWRVRWRGIPERRLLSGRVPGRSWRSCECAWTTWRAPRRPRRKWRTWRTAPFRSRTERPWIGQYGRSESYLPPVGLGTDESASVARSTRS